MIWTKEKLSLVEIVDTPPSTDKEISFKTDEKSAGTTRLNKEELQLLFQGRNLAFLATIERFLCLLSYLHSTAPILIRK